MRVSENGCGHAGDKREKEKECVRGCARLKMRVKCVCVSACVWVSARWCVCVTKCEREREKNERCFCGSLGQISNKGRR